MMLAWLREAQGRERRRREVRTGLEAGAGRQECGGMRACVRGEAGQNGVQQRGLRWLVQRPVYQVAHSPCRPNSQPQQKFKVQSEWRGLFILYNAPYKRHGISGATRSLRV